jgi:glucokinase
MKPSYSIGVDLGGTNLRIAAYERGVEFLDIIRIPTRLSEGRELVVRDMCEAITSLMTKDFGNRRLAGIGIGSPGPLELPEGVLYNPPNLPGWDGFNLRDAIESILRRSVVIENDANAAALAELRLGAGKRHGVESLCVLTMGTGLGNGLILNGTIWHGSSGMGGEAGHMIVKGEDTEACGCGGAGCLEQYASATGMVRMARERMGIAAPKTAHDLATRAREGHGPALAVFTDVAHALAIALASLINTLNLPLYLLGGGVCDAWDLLAPRIFCELRARSYVYRLTQPSDAYPEQDLPEELQRHKTYIAKAELGSEAGLLGACLLPFPPRDTRGR